MEVRIHAVSALDFFADNYPSEWDNNSKRNLRAEHAVVATLLLTLSNNRRAKTAAFSVCPKSQISAFLLGILHDGTGKTGIFFGDVLLSFFALLDSSNRPMAPMNGALARNRSLGKRMINAAVILSSSTCAPQLADGMNGIGPDESPEGRQDVSLGRSPG